ncbi:MAG: YraN family protein [Pyrinomonadaceae bacterium]
MSDLISVFNQNKHSVATKTSRIGRFGEKAAQRFLRKKGYQPVMSNFRVPIGRNRRGVAVTGEIDLIALDGKTLCFIEVKTRSSADFAEPQSAVDLRKQRQITRTARVFRKIFGVGDLDFRFDVVGVVLNGKKAPRIEHFPAFWSERKFRKKFWADAL